MHCETKKIKKLKKLNNEKNKAESRKMGLRLIGMKFHGSISFISTQNAYHALVLDHYFINH